MSREAASYSMTWTRGATAEDWFKYEDSDEMDVDMTGYAARMQVRTMAGQYGTSTTDTLLLELTTENGMLYWDDAASGILRIKVPVANVEPLNPSNEKRAKVCYSIEVYRDETAPASGEYVIPFVQGRITVAGETTR